MITFNRGKLKRLAEAGRLEMAGAYHFDDMMGESRTQGAALPVAMHPGDWHLCKEGTCYLHPSDFRTKSGCAYEAGTSQTGEKLVTMIVHSNCNFKFRIKEAA